MHACACTPFSCTHTHARAQTHEGPGLMVVGMWVCVHTSLCAVHPAQPCTGSHLHTIQYERAKRHAYHPCAAFCSLRRMHPAAHNYTPIIACHVACWVARSLLAQACLGNASRAHRRAVLMLVCACMSTYVCSAMTCAGSRACPVILPHH